MKRSSNRWAVGVVQAFVIVLAVAFPIRAQEEPAAKPTLAQQQDPDTTQAVAPDSNTVDSSITPAGPGQPIDATVKVAGTAMPWAGTTSFLRVGPISIASFEYSYAHDRIGSIRGVPNADFGLSAFNTNLVLDLPTRRSRILLQYLPTFSIRTSAIPTQSALNNAASLALTYEVSHRLTMTFIDSLTQAHFLQTLPSEFLQSDVGSGRVVALNYLQENGTYLDNFVSATFNYQASPKTSFTVSPKYEYSQIQVIGSNKTTDGQSVSTSMAVTHAISPSINFGVLDTIEYFTSNIPGNLAFRTNSNIFNTASLFYAQRLSAKWWIQGRAGAQMSSYGGTTGTSWSASAGGSLVKTFQHSSISLSYDRGRSFSNQYITNLYGERGDASYSAQLMARLNWDASFGYYHELGSGPRTQAKYAATKLGFNLRPDLVLYAGYIYRYQNSPSPQLIVGGQNTVTAGLRWRPAVLPAR